MCIISDTRYDELIEQIRRAKANSKKTTIEYRQLKRFDILTMDTSKSLIILHNKIEKCRSKQQNILCSSKRHRSNIYSNK